MSHIQGQPHPTGTIELLDYIRIDVDEQGNLTQVAVVTHHVLSNIALTQHITTYRLPPVPGQRDLAMVLSATRLGNLGGIITALLSAATLGDTPTDPAPPQP